jgi:hypothetical protein
MGLVDCENLMRSNDDPAFPNVGHRFWERLLASGLFLRLADF